MLPLVLLLCLITGFQAAPTGETFTPSIGTTTVEVTPKSPIELTENQYLIELEDFAYKNGWENNDTRIPQRSGASKYKSLHLFKNEAITVDFCLPIEQDVSIRNVFFSNDGWVDIIKVQIDGKPVGNFRSADSSNWGRLWNEFNFTGPLGEPLNLIQGPHEITFSVEDGDEYGVELDAIKLEFSRPDKTKDLKCPRDADSKDKPDGRILPDASSKPTVSIPVECNSPECPINQGTQSTESTKSTTSHIDHSISDKDESKDQSVSDSTNPTTPTISDIKITKQLNSESSTQMDTTLSDSTKSTDPTMLNTLEPPNQSLSDSSKSTDQAILDSSKQTDRTISVSSKPINEANLDNSKLTDRSISSSTQPPEQQISDSTKHSDQSDLDSTKTTNQPSSDCLTTDCQLTKSQESSYPDNTKQRDQSVTDSSTSPYTSGTPAVCLPPDCQTSTTGPKSRYSQIPGVTKRTHQPGISNPSASDRIKSPGTTKTLSSECSSPDCNLSTKTPEPQNSLNPDQPSPSSKESFDDSGTQPSDCSTPNCRLSTRVPNPQDSSNRSNQSLSETTENSASSRTPDCLTPDCQLTTTVTNSQVSLNPGSTRSFDQSIVEGASSTVSIMPDCVTLECKEGISNPDRQNTSKTNLDCISTDCQSGSSNPSKSDQPTDRPLSNTASSTKSFLTDGTNPSDSSFTESMDSVSNKSTDHSNKGCLTGDCPHMTTNPSNSASTKLVDSSVLGSTKPTDHPLSESNKPTDIPMFNDTKQQTSVNTAQPDCLTPDCQSRTKLIDLFTSVSTDSSVTSDITQPIESSSPDSSKSTDSSRSDSTNSTAVLTPNITRPTESSNQDSNKSTDPSNLYSIMSTDFSNPQSTKPIDFVHRRTTKPNIYSTSPTYSLNPVTSYQTDSSNLVNSKSSDSLSSDTTKPADFSIPDSTEPNKDSAKQTDSTNYGSTKPRDSLNSDSTKSTDSSNPDSTKPLDLSNEDSTKSSASSYLDSSKSTDSPKSSSTKPSDTSGLDSTKPTDSSNSEKTKSKDSSKPASTEPTEPSNHGITKPSYSTNTDSQQSTYPPNQESTKQQHSTNTDSQQSTYPPNQESTKQPHSPDPESTIITNSRNQDSTRPTESSTFDRTESSDSSNSQTRKQTEASNQENDNPPQSSGCQTPECRLNTPSDMSAITKPSDCLTPDCEAITRLPDNSESTDCLLPDCSQHEDTTPTAFSTSRAPATRIPKGLTPSNPSDTKKKDEEIYKISCPKEKLLTIIRNDYLGCSDDGKIRFDLYGATVSEVTFAVPHPSLSNYRYKRSTGATVLWEDGYSRENCSSDVPEKPMLDEGLSQAAASGSLPMTIFPKRTPYLHLAFKLSSSGLDINKPLQPVFTIGACCSSPSNISMSAVDIDTSSTIQLGEQEFQPEDTTKSWFFPVVSDWDDREIEVHIDLSHLQKPIMLNYMRFEIQELDVYQHDSPQVPAKTFLCETKAVKVEGLNENKPSQQKLKFKFNGSQKTTEVSRLVFSPTPTGGSNEPSRPVLVLNPSGSCSFNPPPTIDVTDSTAFILGSTNPTKDPNIAIEEVELEPDVTSDNTSVILHLMGTTFGQSTIRLKVTPTETILTLLQVIPVGSPLSSFLLPCDGKDTTISSDGSNGVSVNDSWKSISGEHLTVRRR